MRLLRLVFAAVTLLMSTAVVDAGDPVGACCYYNGCEVITEADCQALNGSQYQGDGTECPASCTGINMPDPNLRAAVQVELGSYLLTEFNMPRLVSLYADSAGITDLTGLEFAINLESLILDHNQIIDISPLAAMPILSELLLPDNQITDISPLAGLTNLTWIDLYHNHIQDISPLAGLSNVLGVELGWNQITHVPSLSGMTSLGVLELGSNQITSISGNIGLPSLTYLRLDFNQLQDISPLAGLSNLVLLEIYNNAITSIPPLGMTSLEELYISNNNIGNIDGLASMPSLKEVDLNFNQITNISPLAGLTNLEILILANNQITSLPSMAGMTSLVNFHAANNQIGDLSTFQPPPNLTSLFLWNNQISDISSLVGLTNLINLNLSDNQISNISPLAGMTNLRWLGLENNLIWNLGPIMELEDMVGFYIRGNHLVQVPPAGQAAPATLLCHLPLLIENNYTEYGFLYDSYQFENCSPSCGSVGINCAPVGVEQYANRTIVCRVNTCRGDTSADTATGFIVASNGSNSIVITNDHAIDQNPNVNEMRAWFNYECDDCASGPPHSMESFGVIRVLGRNAALDYALLEIDGDPRATYGVANLDVREVSLGTSVYGIHHGSGLPKGYAAGSILNPAIDTKFDGTIRDDIFQYDITAGKGMSGMPIFRSDSHAVTALHFYGVGVCPSTTYGIPMSQIIDDALAQGLLTGYTLNIVEGHCGAADLNCDGNVNEFDLRFLLSNWGSGRAGGSADLNLDGTVDVFDLLLLLANWSL